MKTKIYVCYILFNPVLDRYYIGSTSNLADRLQRHNQGRSKATKAGAPHWELKRCEEFDTLSQARRREAFLKRMKSRLFVEKLIASTPDPHSSVGFEHPD